MPELPTSDTRRPGLGEGVLGRVFAEHVDLPADGADFDADRLPSRGGVFALVADGGRLVQLLCAASIRRAVGRRLAPALDTRSTAPALHGVVRQVWWQLGYSTFENDWLYLRAARQLLGSAYRDALAFAPVWYARIDVDERFPRWTVTHRRDAEDATYAGPFMTRKRAGQFVADLEDLFDLCRYHDVLVRAPQGERCAYYDMGKCPAPCDGTIGLDVYHNTLADSVRFATGDGSAFAARIKTEMADAATALAFERAQRLKESADRAEKALERKGRLATTPDELRYLIVQRGARRSLIRPFFCTGGALDAGDEVALGEVAAHVPAWRERLRSSDKDRHIDAAYRAETTALVCHHLGKGAKASGVYLNVQEVEDCASVAQRIASGFSRS
ncbi:MAG: hypothetical protein H6817_01055 [Phycisphaerales bacterium]|nr:hypothetical protein [Phycisphaerales bacterium]